MTDALEDDDDETLRMDEEAASRLVAQVIAAKAANERGKANAARSLRSVTSVRALLDTHGLGNTAAEYVDALAMTVRRLWEARPVPARALASRERRQALAHTRALLRHALAPSRRAGTIEGPRKKLLDRIDSMHAVVKLAAASDFNAAPVLDRLRASEYTPEDLQALLKALEAIPPGKGAPYGAAYMRLLRGGVLAWEASGRTERYTLNDYADPPTLGGPLPAFLRALIELAELTVPNDNTLHTHLVKVKNL